MKAKLFLASIALVLLTATTSSLALECGDDSATANTDKGAVAGSYSDKAKVCGFKGIPFAAPPVGELRFTMPRPHDPWEGERDSTEFSGKCVQNPMSLFPSNEIIGTEDCLYLNVWSPEEAGSDNLKPVMVFIHGGGFILGAASQDTYVGKTMASRGDVVLVTTNYRLGPFGFYTHPALKDEQGRVSNYGMYDQIAALQWVKDNIKNFGGDPDNVTIFGESAGGMSVGALLVAPPAEGLFHKAVIQSGPVIVLNTRLEKATKDGIEGAERLGCPDMDTAAECLRSLSATEVMKGVPSTIAFVQMNEVEGALPYMPVTGTELLPELPIIMFEKQMFDPAIPVMLGTNKDEASYFTAAMKLNTVDEFHSTYDSYSKTISKNFEIDALTPELKELYPVDSYKTPRLAFNDIFCDVAFTCPTRMLANTIKRKNPNVYLYHFVKSPQEKGMMKDWGAFHGAELAYVFGNFTFMGIKFSSKENRILSSKMIALWSSFARDGKPGAKKLPEWPEYESDSEVYMELGNKLEVKKNLKTERCVYLEKQISTLLEEKQ